MEKQPNSEHGKPQSSDMASSQETKESSEPKSSVQESILLKVSELESNPMCRICYNGPSRERLLRPCKCKGTIEYVHRHCLERWLESTNCETCELCHHHFTTRRTRKSFWEWCRQPETRHDRRNFIGDFTCFAFLTPLGIATFWLCAEGAIYYQKVKNSTLETIALVTLAVFLISPYDLVKMEGSQLACSDRRQVIYIATNFVRGGGGQRSSPEQLSQRTPHSVCATSAGSASGQSALPSSRLRKKHRADHQPYTECTSRQSINCVKLKG
ncbi:e3 ubiquitin-protein ligase MARCH3 [Caerostris extrusa]|uniref:E3 ubiquitin-protein ligase MARCH3 n=1 Tax=Caerostris extrusa TaxID=172846 RepID=A0AAV4TC14_CAEEX|nr:e3 ubiquitin-protein ligase MARCH3 [Caerostris extrusa]